MTGRKKRITALAAAMGILVTVQGIAAYQSAFDKGRQSTFSVIRLNQEIKTVAGVAGFFSAPVLSIGKTIEAAYIANIIVIHSRLAQRAETVDHTISILISTLQKPEAASEFPVDFAPIHC